jgi:hypothetical protein
MRKLFWASKQGGTAGTPVPYEIVDFMRDGSFFIYFSFFRKLALLLLKVFNFRFRMLAFRGACGEHQACSGLTQQESHTLHFNQPSMNLFFGIFKSNNLLEMCLYIIHH